MNEEGKEGKKGKQRKSKISIVAVAIVTIMLIGIIYFLSKDDLIKASAKDAAYSAKINSNGQLVYTMTDSKSGYEHQSSIEEMVEDVENTIGDYMGGTEEQNLKDTQYLIEAESVSKLPYIDDIPQGELNGNIKFYRYINTEDENGVTANESEITAEDIKEENRLKYKKFDEFNALVEEYKVSANREVFNYFTIDEEGTVLVAYGSEENRTIETGVDSSLIDRDLNVDIIKEKSGQTYSKTNDNDFAMAKYEISTKPVDYESLTAQYVMPANLLYSLLIQTGDIEFVKEIASLAYDTEIAIGIYDNINHYTRTETYTYYKMLNMNIETSLEFKDTLVSITDSSPNISLKYEDLLSTPYVDIPVWCESITNENGVIEHEIKYLPGGGVSPVEKPDYNMYITGTDANNKITSLGTKDSATNITKYTNIKTSMSTPSIGILLADTWISRWEITYAKEDLPGSDGTPSPSTELEDANIQSYTDNESVFGLFEENISVSLNNHAQKLKEDAITQIINRTPEEVFKVQPTKVTVGKSKKQDILSDHLTKMNADGTNGCGVCTVELIKKSLTSADIEEIYNAIINEDGKLKGTIVETHYKSELSQYITRKNSENQRKADELTEDRKDEFENQLKQEGTISPVQKLSATKDYKEITYISSTISSTTKYKKNDVESGGRDKEKDGEKFSKIYNKRKYYVARRKMQENTSWFWDYIRENEDTAKLEDVLRYLLYTATDSEIFGEFDETTIEEIFSAFEPKMQRAGIVTGTVSPFGTEMEREDFIVAAQEYKDEEYYQRNLASIAGDFYDICVENGVNPGMAFSWACVETGFGKDDSIPNNNLFGMAVYNGENSGSSYSTRQDSIRDFCQWVIKNSTSTATYNQAQEFVTVNPIFEGTGEDNIYVLFCRYMYLGDTHIADEPDFNNPAGQEYYEKNGSNWGSGGRIYIHHMYELGGLYKNEYAERCGHPNGSDKTSLEEKADYVEYSVKKRIKIATDIFGNQVFIGGTGEFTESDDSEIRGYYTSRSGRTYTEWIQSVSVGCGAEIIASFPQWGTMGKVGCPIYAAAILTSSEGIDITPSIVNQKYYTGNETSTVQAILNAYSIPKTAKKVGDKLTYITKLQEGYGFATYVNSSSGFARSQHWIVVADIRNTELGSSEGYDVYILSSTTRGLKETRWHPIESVINNLYDSSSYGCYISNE